MNTEQYLEKVRREYTENRQRIAAREAEREQGEARRRCARAMGTLAGYLFLAVVLVVAAIVLYAYSLLGVTLAVFAIWRLLPDLFYRAGVAVGRGLRDGKAGAR